MSECSSNQVLNGLKRELSDFLWGNLVNGKRKIEQPMGQVMPALGGSKDDFK